MHGINYKFIRQNISESGFLCYLVHDVNVLRPGKFSASVSAGQRGVGRGDNRARAQFKATVPSVTTPSMSYSKDSNLQQPTGCFNFILLLYSNFIYLKH